MFEVTYVVGSCVAAFSVGRFGWPVLGTSKPTSILFEETKQTFVTNMTNGAGYKDSTSRGCFYKLCLKHWSC
jgi:hypothetical protein